MQQEDFVTCLDTFGFCIATVVVDVVCLSGWAFSQTDMETWQQTAGFREVEFSESGGGGVVWPRSFFLVLSLFAFVLVLWMFGNCRCILSRRHAGPAWVLWQKRPAIRSSEPGLCFVGHAVSPCRRPASQRQNNRLAGSKLWLVAPRARSRRPIHEQNVPKEASCEVCRADRIVVDDEFDRSPFSIQTNRCQVPSPRVVWPPTLRNGSNSWKQQVHRLGLFGLLGREPVGVSLVLGWRSCTSHRVFIYPLGGPGFVLESWNTSISYISPQEETRLHPAPITDTLYNLARSL